MQDFTGEVQGNLYSNEDFSKKDGVGGAASRQTVIATVLYLPEN
jgi:hypothetical protein